MIYKKGPIREKNINILNRAAEKIGSALKVFLNDRAIKKYRVLADQAFSHDSSQDGSQKVLITLIGYKFLAAFLAAFFPVFLMRNIIFMALACAVSLVVGFFIPDFLLYSQIQEKGGFTKSSFFFP